MRPSRQRAVVIGLIFVGVLIAGFFGLRAIFAFREFRRHEPPPLAEALNEQVFETDVELIRDWMTVPYISRTYQVNPRTLFEALGLSRRGNEEKSLLQLNDEFFPDQPGIVNELVKAVVKANQPVPTGVIPNEPVTPASP
jgi:hypothetical protein